jgi:uridine kinase
MTSTLPRPYLIGIAGFSGSGKTTVAHALARELPASIFSLDAYYFDHPELSFEERCQLNYDHPDTIDGQMVAEHLHKLSERRAITRPVYDFPNHRRAAHTERMEPNDFIIEEGLFTLHWPAVREQFGTKVYMEATHDVCLPRRERRDREERGRSSESVHAQYAATVRPMADEFILPSRQYADLIIACTGQTEQAVKTILGHVRGHVNARLKTTSNR